MFCWQSPRSKNELVMLNIADVTNEGNGIENDKQDWI
jgi:hypothetical protein